MAKIVLTKEMGFTRDEFFRILPSALDHRSFEQSADVVIVAIGNGVLQLNVGEQCYRQIASISLPYLSVEFVFEELAEDQVDEIMRFFNLRYQRGGG